LNYLERDLRKVGRTGGLNIWGRMSSKIKETIWDSKSG